MGFCKYTHKKCFFSFPQNPFKRLTPPEIQFLTKKLQIYREFFLILVLILGKKGVSYPTQTGLAFLVRQDPPE